MGRKKETKMPSMRLASVMDTETTTMPNGQSFVCIWTFNDLWDNPVSEYDNSKSEPVIHSIEFGAVSHIVLLVEEGKKRDVAPILCVYNLLFDVKPILSSLIKALDASVKVVARSRTGIYCLDFYQGSRLCLRIWDTFFLEPAGLAAMGQSAGLEKLEGSWDYSKIRTPDTPLTDEEQAYAERDVQVIPAYLHMLLKQNSWMTEEMLGTHILTRTGIVRRFATEELYGLEVNGKKIGVLFDSECKRELPQSFEQYALRRACFLGGLCFTSGLTAQRVVENEASFDTVSMHHLFLNGRLVPVKFRKADTRTLKLCADNVINTPLSSVLQRYDRPFSCGLHVHVVFKNLKLKGVFEHLQTGIIPLDRFVKRPVNIVNSLYGDGNEASQAAESAIRNSGYMSVATGAQFAFGKLMRAEACSLYCTEIELWNIAQVYSFDSVEVLEGEMSCNFVKPPDYISLQSNILFSQKQEAKRILAEYVEGTPYCGEISESVPSGLAERLRAGEARHDEITSWYILSVKAQFNAIYGTQVQNQFQPSFNVDANGDVDVDADTITDSEHFTVPKRSRIDFNYGMRIAAGSRMHLVIAMLLVEGSLEDSAIITGGDTDSLKISLNGATIQDVDDALKPLHDAADRALARTQARVRESFPELASDFKDVGHFQAEDCGGAMTYPLHIEGWSKCRMSMDVDGKVHITCAGLARPKSGYTIVDWLNDFINGSEKRFRMYAPQILGFNVTLSERVSCALVKSTPDFSTPYQQVVKDDDGETAFVKAPRAYSLHLGEKTLADGFTYEHASSIAWLIQHGHVPEIEPREIDVDDDGNAILYSM